MNLEEMEQAIKELRDIVSKMGVKVDFTSQEAGQALKELNELKEAGFMKRGTKNLSMKKLCEELEEDLDGSEKKEYFEDGWFKNTGDEKLYSDMTPKEKMLEVQKIPTVSDGKKEPEVYISVFDDRCKAFREHEASGGEKSHIGNFSDVEKSKIADDSKPPEPTHENDLKEIEDTDMPITMLAHIKKRVRDATRQEPRENDFDVEWFDHVLNTDYGRSDVIYFLKKQISEFVKDLKELPEQKDGYRIFGSIEILREKWEDKLK